MTEFKRAMKLLLDKEKDAYVYYDIYEMCRSDLNDRNVWERKHFRRVYDGIYYEGKKYTVLNSRRKNTSLIEHLKECGV